MLASNTSSTIIGVQMTKSHHEREYVTELEQENLELEARVKKLEEANNLCEISHGECVQDLENLQEAFNKLYVVAHECAVAFWDDHRRMVDDWSCANMAVFEQLQSLTSTSMEENNTSVSHHFTGDGEEG